MVKRTARQTKTSEAPPAHAHSTNAFVRGYRATIAFLKKDGALPWIANLLIAFIIIKFILYPLMGLAFGTSLPLVAVMSGSMTHDLADGTICGAAPQNYDGSLDAYWRTCGAWYTARNITRAEFETFPFTNGFQKGDIMLLVGVNRGTTQVGDVIVFESRDRFPIIHRVVWTGTDARGNKVFATKGDHNSAQISQFIVVNNLGVASSCSSPSGEALPCGYGVPVTRNTPGALAYVDELSIPQDAVIGRAVLKIPWLGWVRVGIGAAVDSIQGK